MPPMEMFLYVDVFAEIQNRNDDRKKIGYSYRVEGYIEDRPIGANRS